MKAKREHVSRLRKKDRHHLVVRLSDGTYLVCPNETAESIRQVFFVEPIYAWSEMLGWVSIPEK